MVSPSAISQVIKIMTTIFVLPATGNIYTIVHCDDDPARDNRVGKHLRWAILHDLYTNFDKGVTGFFIKIGIYSKDYVVTPVPIKVA